MSTSDAPISNAALVALAREQTLHRLIDSVEDYAIFALTPEGYVASWNRGAERINGYKTDEIIGRHFSEFYPEEALAVDWPATELRDAAANGHFEDEGWRLRKDGSRFWANVVITALRDVDGRLLGFTKVTRDLSERRRQEEQLRRSEESLRLLIDGVKDHAIFMLDDEGRVTEWNAGAERVHRYAREDIIGRDVALLYTEEERAAARPQSDLAIAREQGYCESTGWRQRPDGSRFGADVTITVVRDKDGTPQGFVQITRDVTERLRVQQLETQGQRVNEFIAMLAHELRNPMAPIINAVAMLEKRVTEPELRGCVELIGRQSAHLARLVDDLLDISRINSGKIRLRREPLDLARIVEAAADSARAGMAEFGHRLAVTLPAEPLVVSGDATRLTQLLLNLLGNAAKYTPQGGHIEVRLEHHGERALLRVIDNGIGMSREMLEQAFEPFVQGERELDRSGGGLGIGLALVKRIAELHGGAIVAHSDGHGQGTEMIVSLPLPSGVVLPAPAEAPAAPALRRRHRVLVVDDNVDAATSLAALLELSGYATTVAHDGAAALQLAAAESPDAVLLDLGLPGMNGYEVARRLRALPLPEGTRLIAMTGYGRDDDKLATRDAGFDAHLVKPVELEVVIDALEAATPRA